MKTTNNIYNRTNIVQLQRDNLSIRKSAPKYTQYYDRAQKNIKRCKIVVDSWDNGKILYYMATNHKAIKEEKIDYYICIEENKVYKLREYINIHKGTTLDYNLIYHGTKSQALKKLDNLVA